MAPTLVSIIAIISVILTCCCAVQLNRLWRNSDVYAQLYHTRRRPNSNNASTNTSGMSPVLSPDTLFWSMQMESEVKLTRPNLTSEKTFTSPTSSYPDNPPPTLPILVLNNQDNVENKEGGGGEEEEEKNNVDGVDGVDGVDIVVKG